MSEVNVEIVFLSGATQCESWKKKSTGLQGEGVY